MDFGDTIARARRAQRQGTHNTDARFVLLLLALAALGGSAIHWWRIQSSFTDDVLIASAYTAILVLAPPTLTSFLIPWSPGGMLLQKIHARTWGNLAVIACALYLLYYSFQIQWSWWAAQPVVAETGMIYQQVLIGIIGFIIIPALLWAPVSDEELVEKLKQAQLVKRYELQTQADIAILQATLLRAQQQALIGFANLTVGEREDLAAVMRGLVGGIDATIQEMAGTLNASVRTVYGSAADRTTFQAPAFTDDLINMVEYVAATLEAKRLDVTPSPTQALVTAPNAERYAALESDRNVAVARERAEVVNVAEAQRASGSLENADPRDAATLGAVRVMFGGGALSAELLSRRLGIGESTAGKWIAAWRESGHIESMKQRGFYCLTEQEA
jgi:hypothetical protein